MRRPVTPRRPNSREWAGIDNDRTKMSHNPYSPSDVPTGDAKRRGSVACTFMFWLSCILAFGMLGIASNGCYQYWLYRSQGGVVLPSSILGESVCVGIAGLGLLYSALKWRRRMIRIATVSFAASLLLFFFGPFFL